MFWINFYFFIWSFYLDFFSFSNFAMCFIISFLFIEFIYLHTYFYLAFKNKNVKGRRLLSVVVLSWTHGEDGHGREEIVESSHYFSFANINFWTRYSFNSKNTSYETQWHLILLTTP